MSIGRVCDLVWRVAVVITLLASPVVAADKVKVGVLRFVSSGGLFIAQERAYFAAEGLDVELVFFEAAQPIAVAVASGDIQFGVTAITAGTLNLAGKGALKMVAAQGAERARYRNNALVVSKAAHERGITGLDKLAGTSIAMTQVGSSYHYMMGRIAEKAGIGLDKIDLKPLQSVPNMVAAVKSGQVDGALLPPQFARPLIAAGDVKVLSYFSDIDDYQYGAVFTPPKLITDNRSLVERFVRAYAKGNADYARALLQLDASGEFVIGDEAKASAAQIAKHIYPSETAAQAVPKILASVVFVEATGVLNRADIERQITWYKTQKLVDAKVDAQAVVDMSFAK